MDYTSTKNSNIQKSLSQAILSGLADDGGLYLPHHFPQIDLTTLDSNATFADFSAQVLAPYFAGDQLSKQLNDITRQAFNFPIPLKKLSDDTFIMELFHGPTLSFKDVGARFLAQCMNQLHADQKTTIAVATSGDTGSAVASAFYQKENIQVVILFPKGLISERQEHQISCWGDNILALKVNGNFDDCQRLVKALFQHKQLKSHTHLSTANSINIGRLLPQICYYAYHSLQFFNHHKIKPGFIIPSGNLGNVTAAFWAKTMGFPIREIVLATNANTVITDYLQTGDYQPRESISTLANAMDVGKPSNFARLQSLFPQFADFKENIKAISVDDEHIQQAIQHCYQSYQHVICPHTATAYFVRQQLSDQPWIIAATADPCKFETIVEPLLGIKVPLPQQLQDQLKRVKQAQQTQANLEQVAAQIIELF